MVTYQSERLKINVLFNQLHNLNTFEINESKFVVFQQAIRVEGNLNIKLSDYNIVFLSPIEAQDDIVIEAISVIALSSITSKEGKISVYANGKCISAGCTIMSQQNNLISARKGLFSASLDEKRHQSITASINKGIGQRRISDITDALADIYDAVIDPSGENECPNIDNIKVLEFFDVPLQDPT